MKFSSAAVAATAILAYVPNGSLAFTPSAARFSIRSTTNTNTNTNTNNKSRSSRIHATVEDEKTKTDESADGAQTKVVNIDNVPTTDIDPDPDAVEVEVEGLPWWWDLVWKLDMMKTGEPGTDCTFGDSANVLRTNIEQIYGGFPSLDGCPLAEGELADIADGTQFIGLQRYQKQFGSPYKLCFGPKTFLVISDPVQAKHILRDANSQYDKGLLAEILEPIMGKGLIPADPATWAVRRRQIVPAFHKGE